MAKQFLDIPVEVAKELIERVLADPSHNLTDYAGGVVSYDTEVWLNENDFSFLSASNSVMYFGTFFCGDPSSKTQVGIYDSVNPFNTIETVNGLLSHAVLHCCIWNQPVSILTGCYFYGYKFNITY
jgi:hypothetical protein